MLNFCRSNNKKILGLAIVAALILLGIYIFKVGFTPKDNFPHLMKLTSPSFVNGGVMPDRFTCRGDGHSPALDWNSVPEGAASLALIVDDPDAPSGDFVHWLVWNINVSLAGLEEGATPRGSVEGENSMGQSGYMAPCPPSGTHHYHFKLYALDKKLELPGTTAKSDLLAAMEEHILDQAELVGIVSAK